MAVHERQSIREAAKAALLSKTGAANRVYASRGKAWRPVELPGIDVRVSKETSARETLDGALVRKATLSIMAIHSLTERIDDAVDELALEVEQAIDADPTLGGLVLDATLTETDLDLVDAQNQPIGAAILTYEVEYHTAPRA